MTHQSERADLAVVGGSFAGLACARRAALRGLDTVVLDRRTTPGARPHTTGILVREAAELLPDCPARLLRQIDGIRLYSPTQRPLDLQSPDYYFQATDTEGLLGWMARRASEAGADCRFGSRVQEISRKDDGWALQESGLEAKYLVAADGARSTTAAQLGLPSNTEFLVGIEYEYDGIDGLDPDRLHVFLDHDIARGYIAWIVPGVVSVQVGLAARQPHRADMPGFLSRLEKLFDLSNATRVSQRGGLIPCGGPLRHWSTEGAMALGDSAGMVSPLTAGGIHPALQLGRLAGDSIAEFLLSNGPDPAVPVRQACPRYRTKRLLRHFNDRWSPSNQTLDRLFHWPLFRAFAQVVFFHNRGLFSSDAWRELLQLYRKEALRG